MPLFVGPLGFGFGFGVDHITRQNAATEIIFTFTNPASSMVLGWMFPRQFVNQSATIVIAAQIDNFWGGEHALQSNLWLDCRKF